MNYSDLVWTYLEEATPEAADLYCYYLAEYYGLFPPINIWETSKVSLDTIRYFLAYLVANEKYRYLETVIFPKNGNGLSFLDWLSDAQQTGFSTKLLKAWVSNESPLKWKSN